MNAINKLIILFVMGLFLASCVTNKIVETDLNIEDDSVSLVAFQWLTLPKKQVLQQLNTFGWNMVNSVNTTNYVFILTHQCTQGFFPIIARCTSQMDAINRENGKSITWKQTDPDYVQPVEGSVYGGRPGALENSISSLMLQIENDIDKLVGIGFPKPKSL